MSNGNLFAKELGRSTPDHAQRWVKLTDDEGTFALFFRRDRDLLGSVVIHSSDDAASLALALSIVHKELKEQGR